MTGAATVCRAAMACVFALATAAPAEAQVLVTGETGSAGGQAIMVSGNALTPNDFGTLKNFWVQYGYGLSDRVDVFAAYGNISVFGDTQHYVGAGSNISILRRARQRVDLSFFNNVSLPITRRDQASTVLATLALVASHPVKIGSTTITPYGGFNTFLPIGHVARGVFTPIETLHTGIAGVAVPMGKRWAAFAESPAPAYNAVASVSCTSGRGDMGGHMTRSMRALVLSISVAAPVATLIAADGAWPWAGAFADKAVSMLVIGDIDIQLRADPATAFAHIGATLKNADLVYANLEGMLVKPEGPEKDIPDKRGWRHPGPDGVLALDAWNVRVVGVANNVAYDRRNILETLKVLDAHGIAHTGGGANIVEAHAPAIVERKGVKIGFLQYTARWYQDSDQIATATEPGVAKISSRDGVTIDPADVERVRRDIRALRPRVDVVVVSHHNRDGATATQFGAPPADRPSGTRRDNHISEEYQKAFAHLAHDAGADFVYGHGTHTVQGVEVYDGRPILYAIGHSAFDQPGYENSKDGLVVRVVIENKRIRRVSFVPVTRDARNDVLMLDPSAGDGAALVDVIRKLSPGVTLKIDGQEVVLLDAPAQLSKKQD